MQDRSASIPRKFVEEQGERYHSSTCANASSWRVHNGGLDILLQDAGADCSACFPAPDISDVCAAGIGQHEGGAAFLLPRLKLRAWRDPVGGSGQRPALIGVLCSLGGRPLVREGQVSLFSMDAQR